MLDQADECEAVPNDAYCCLRVRWPHGIGRSTLAAEQHLRCACGDARPPCVRACIASSGTAHRSTSRLRHAWRDHGVVHALAVVIAREQPLRGRPEEADEPGRGSFVRSHRHMCLPRREQAWTAGVVAVFAQPIREAHADSNVGRAGRTVLTSQQAMAMVLIKPEPVFGTCAHRRSAPCTPSAIIIIYYGTHARLSL